MVRYEDRLARALAIVINLLDPRRDRARRRPVEHRPPLRQRAGALAGVGVLAIVSTRGWCARAHGDSSGVRGAAWLWTAAEAADAAG